jgi:hypothetical protein
VYHISNLIGLIARTLQWTPSCGAHHPSSPTGCCRFTVATAARPCWRGTRLPTSPPGPVPAAASCAPTGHGPTSTGIGTTGSRAPIPLTKTAEPSAQPSCAMRWTRHHYLHHHHKGATAAGNTARSTATVARCSALRSV